MIFSLFCPHNGYFLDGPRTWHTRLVVWKLNPTLWHLCLHEDRTGAHAHTRVFVSTPICSWKPRGVLACWIRSAENSLNSASGPFLRDLVPATSLLVQAREKYLQTWQEFCGLAWFRSATWSMSFLLAEQTRPISESTSAWKCVPCLSWFVCNRFSFCNAWTAENCNKRWSQARFDTNCNGWVFNALLRVFNTSSARHKEGSRKIQICCFLSQPENTHTFHFLELPAQIFDFTGFGFAVWILLVYMPLPTTHMHTRGECQ